ncbi:MAG TPA: flagellar biosynthetic protein FliO [Verrucomicrobiae bacterium]|nr:flagellar biosynthetic protein FliO [Verrucomicrobiae bacterium]
MTNLPSMTSALPDMGASLLRVVGALVVVIAVFLAGVWLFKNWQRVTMRKGAAPKLNVLEVRPLGQRQAIYVVGYEQQRLLIASCSTGVTLLSHLPAADEQAAPETPKMNFAQAFQQVLARKS